MSDFVSFEITKKLKEKGYPLLKVRKQNGDPFIYDLPEEHPDWQNCDAYYIPTIDQVLKWLREEEKLHVEPCVISREEVEFAPKYTYWSFGIMNIEGGYFIYQEYHKFNDDRFDSYEDAALAGIEYTLDNLI